MNCSNDNQNKSRMSIFLNDLMRGKAVIKEN